MFRGETITTVVSGFPVPINNIADIHIIFKHNNTILIEKTLSDCIVNEDSISFELTQEESLSLSVGSITRHIIVVTVSGQRFESNPSTMPVLQTAKGEVL